MNWTQIEAHWDELAPQLQERWGRFTDEDINTARAGRDELVRCVLTRYGIDPEIAERHVDDWLNSASIPLPTRTFVEPGPEMRVWNDAANADPR